MLAALSRLMVSGLVVTGVLVTAGTGTAAADETPRTQGGATATIGGLKTYGAAVIHETGGDQQVSAGLFEMSVDGGGTLQTYCVDLDNPTQRDAKYQETSWSGTSLGANKNAGRIRWILENSYPQVNDLAALAAKAGAGSLSEQDAAAGTQVAIWRYSDGADVDAVDPQAEKLAAYLEKNARDLAEPKASLTLDPPAISGHPGGLLGPVTVHTDAQSVTVIPAANAATAGARIVGEDGEAITSAANGSKIYFEVPEDAADGSVDVTVQASTTVPVGRAFTSDSRSQTQILAGSSESTVSATASATWAAKGAVPALSAYKDCAKGALAVTAANQGDEAFTFELMGTRHTIPAGTTQAVSIPLQEDQSYDFTITGPNGFTERFTGVLDCKTQSSTAGDSVQTLSEPSPVSAGTVKDTTATDDPTDLAETGGSTMTPLIAGVAIGFVVLGGAALLLVRKKEAQTED